MSAAGRGQAWAAAVVALSVAFAVLAHASIIEGVSPTVGALLSLVPLAVLALWAARRTRQRVLVAVGFAAAAGMLWQGWASFERNFPNLFFLEHAGANLVLAFVFGRTLRAGREPLCTTFARLLHGQLPPEVERYTRQVTVAWTLFFVALFAASAFLYTGGFLGAWSLLANILSPFLVAAMFVVEYAVRHRVLPHWERIGVLGGIRAFSRHFAAARAHAPR